jgi:inosine/xanthosine triphosphate pyrophosphatase family protein
MNRKKVIYFKTSNAQKAEEVKKQFERYGVDVVYNKEHLVKMKINNSSDQRYFAVLEEHTSLLGKYGELKNEHLEPVINRSTLVYRVEKKSNYVGDDICVGSITKEVHGYLDFERKVSDEDKEHVFGFDRVFVVSQLNQSFFELKKCCFSIESVFL